MSKRSHTGLTYRDAGVDIARGNRLVERIQGVAARTRRPGVLQGLGGFGALFELPMDRFRQPVLVAGTDGVGTKLRLALETGRHDRIGIDLVAMCANDLVVQGAEPLFFLDYYATGHLDLEVAEQVIEGIGEGCEQAGMALIGGETAEMPGMYGGGEYDLAGFCVGVVEREAIIDGRQVAEGDVVLALASSGPHSNGYSLVRKILELSGTPPGSPLAGRPIIDHLLEPTRIYVRPLLALIERVPVHALAHITGGGITENLPRVLPPHTRAVIDRQSWQEPAVFTWLAEQGQVPRDEMYRTFNCGVGMTAVVAAEKAGEATLALAEAGERVWQLGHIERSGEARPGVVYR